MTLSQLMTLYEHAVSRKVRDMKFSAILHGADPKELEDKEMPSVTTKESNLRFGDPAEYANMSEEDKKIVSDKMRKKFFMWAGVKKDG